MTYRQVMLTRMEDEKRHQIVTHVDASLAVENKQVIIKKGGEWSSEIWTVSEVYGPEISQEEMLYLRGKHLLFT